MGSFDSNTKFDYVGVRDTTISKYYLVSVTSSELKKTVVGYLGEPFNESISSSWKSVMDFVGSAGGGLEILAETFGVSTKTTNMFRLYWDRNEPLKLKFTMVFRAFADAYKEVEKPIRVLESIASPGTKEFINWSLPVSKNKTIELGGDILSPPGPNPLGEGGDNILVNIGGKIFRDVVIVSVVPTRSLVKNKDGYPLFATVVVEVNMTKPTTRGSSEIDYGD